MKKQDVIEYYGTMAAAARALGVKRQAVHQWPDEVPLGRAYQLQVITNGELRVQDERSAA